MEEFWAGRVQGVLKTELTSALTAYLPLKEIKDAFHELCLFAHRQGLGLRVWGAGCRMQGVGCRVLTCRDPPIRLGEFAFPLVPTLFSPGANTTCAVH